MPNEAAAVTDTHPLLFHAAGGKRLGRAAARLFNRCEAREAILYIPSAVIWECRLLVRAAKVDLKRSIRSFFDDLFTNPAYQPLDITPEHVFLAEELRFDNDPFDGLIAASARALDLPLVTRDRDISESGKVRTIWN